MLHLLGLNHKTAPVEVRERFALPASRLGHALQYVKDVPGVSEAAILSTCNRFEIYAWGDAKAGPRLRESMVGYHSFGGAHDLEKHFYSHSENQAVKHLFEVASGLDSLVLGEAEILGQVKVALQNASNYGTSGANLDELFRRSIMTGKRARTETGISRGALSVGAAGVELAKQIFGSLKGHTVLILGAGKMSARVAQCLVSSGAHRVLVSNRTFERAQELAQTFNDEGAGAEAIGWDDFPQRLIEADIIISSTRAPHYVVTPTHIQSVAKKRRRSLLLIDIAVPRDIDPACSKFDDVFVFDIDDLQSVVEQGKAARSGEITQVQGIISQEIGSWTQWLGTRNTAPVIAKLARRASQIRENEVEATLARLSHLSDKDRASIEAMARAISQKTLHAPIAHLKNGGANDADAIARAFKLDSDIREEDASGG
jgi:glutamyl-tRNA reductase